MRTHRLHCAAAIGSWLFLAGGGRAADSSYPFEGSWVRADRTCSATSTRERIYTARDVTSSRSKCMIRKVAAGSGNVFELFERCERPNERPSPVRETIQITGPSSMTLTRQTARLKLSRSLRFTKCPAVQGSAPKPAR